ncbi:MAG TPA: CRISPR system precrRNA processing endoribonuclease RAMP protein Cas6 [Planctomicrobium sp.]|nr:CRISPR system precrRNA processing endoribonuclease RAMP protein Cas6 [Planctomicrobium sp.]
MLTVPISEHPHSELLLPSIRAIRLEVRTRWKRPTSIPGPILANVLRGALGITFRKLVCPTEWMDHVCAECPLYRDCAYGQVFMPSPPADSKTLRLIQDLPRPFVIEPPGLHPDDRVTDEGLTFRLMLFGTAIEQLPYFISTLDRLGHDGMGRERVPFTIERISTCHPAGEETLFTGGSSSVSLPKRFITTDDLIAPPWPVEVVTQSDHSDARRRILARMGRPDTRETKEVATSTRPRLKLKFLTPLLLKSGSSVDADGKRIAAQEVRDRPPMGVIIRRLRDRVSTLCTFFGEPWKCPDFSAWGTWADSVTIVDSRTTWLTRQRRSTRTGQSHEISGLLGNTTYEFPDEETFQSLSRLLRIGELLHAGKNAPWGNGGIRGMQLNGETR